MIWATRLISVLALAASLPLSGAKPLSVWSPAVVYPHRSTVWRVGDTHKVVWDTRNPPAEITDQNGSLYLVQNDRILLDRKLGDNFSLFDGEFEIRVPEVTPGSYRVVLFGDSGNWSEQFDIKA